MTPSIGIQIPWHWQHLPGCRHSGSRSGIVPASDSCPGFQDGKAFLTVRQNSAIAAGYWLTLHEDLGSGTCIVWLYEGERGMSFADMLGPILMVCSERSDIVQYPCCAATHHMGVKAYVHNAVLTDHL